MSSASESRSRNAKMFPVKKKIESGVLALKWAPGARRSGAEIMRAASRSGAVALISAHSV